MGKIVVMLLGVVLVTGAVYGASKLSNSSGNKTYSWRYKMIVRVETPEGLKTGSTVRQVNVVKSVYEAKMVPKGKETKKHYSFSEKVSGEAVVVDLGQRGVVFSLIDYDAYADALYAFNAKHEEVTNLPIGKKAELKTNLPRFVTFEDFSDPKSVKLVYMKEKYAGDERKTDRFEEIFGEGVKLKSISIEITDEPMTWGVVDKYLPETFSSVVKDGWRKLSREDRKRLSQLVNFKIGEKR
jgi:hypothetical protein